MTTMIFSWVSISRLLAYPPSMVFTQEGSMRAAKSVENSCSACKTLFVLLLL